MTKKKTGNDETELQEEILETDAAGTETSDDMNEDLEQENDSSTEPDNSDPVEKETEDGDGEVEAEADAQPEENLSEEELESEQIDQTILEIRKNASRAGSRVEKMSKAKKKEVYSSEHVITEFGEETLQTESMEKKKEYSELVASQKSKKILKGRITGFHYANEDDPTSTILAEIDYGKGLHNILIPSYLLFDYELDEKHATKEANRTIAQLVQRRINAPIDFVVQTIDKNGVAYADRLLALSLKGVNNYVGKGLNPARITSGLLVESTVVMVSRTFVIVDALGAEIKIPQNELSYHHIGDAREEFHVGDKVNVRILSACEYKVSKYNSNYTLIDAKASIKAATPDKRKEYFDNFRVGGRYAAKVTYVEDNIYVNLANKMDAMVAFPKFGDNPVRGDERIVEVTGKDPDKLFIYGVFVQN